MSCHPPTRQVGPYQSEGGPHDEPIQQPAPADLHVKPYAERHVKVYADSNAAGVFGLELVQVEAGEFGAAQPSAEQQVHDRAIPQRPGVMVYLALEITVAASAKAMEAVQPVQYVS